MLHSRIQRVEELIHQELARIVSQDLDDPRVRFASVNAVKVSKDLNEAVVQVSFLNDTPENTREGMAGLEAARGYIKRLLAARIVLKRLPDLHFKLDTSPTKAFEIFHILEDIRRETPPSDTPEQPESSENQ